MLSANSPGGERLGTQLKAEISATVMIFLTAMVTVFLLSVVVLYLHVFASFSIFLPSCYVLYFTPEACIAHYSVRREQRLKARHAAHHISVFHTRANTASRSCEDTRVGFYRCTKLE
jgi:hypothetical protein